MESEKNIEAQQTNQPTNQPTNLKTLLTGAVVPKHRKDFASSHLHGNPFHSFKPTETFSDIFDFNLISTANRSVNL